MQADQTDWRLAQASSCQKSRSGSPTGTFGWAESHRADLRFPRPSQQLCHACKWQKTTCLDHELARWFKVLSTHPIPHPHQKKTHKAKQQTIAWLPLCFYLFCIPLFISSSVFLQWPCSYTITQRERERIMELLTFWGPPNLMECYGR